MHDFKNYDPETGIIKNIKLASYFLSRNLKYVVPIVVVVPLFSSIEATRNFIIQTNPSSS